MTSIGIVSLENSRVFAVVQIVTGLTVVLGLILVTFELQQTRELTRSQLVQEQLTLGMTEYIARYGENVGEHIAAACAESDTLTAEGTVVLDAVFNFQMWWVSKFKLRIDEGLGGTTLSREEEALRRIRYIAGFPQGKAWLENFDSRDPEIRRFVEHRTPNLQPKPCTDLIALLGPGLD